MPLVVYGASGHGKVVADAARAAGLHVDGFVDDDVSKHGTTFFGALVLGGRAWLEERRDVDVAWGIGSNRVRESLHARVVSLGHRAATIVHPRANVALSARIGEGTVVFAGTTVNADAAVGVGAILNTGAIIEHDCVIGDFAHVSPGARLGGGVTVGARTHIGIGATVIQLIEIGADAVVGAGSVVVRNLPPSVVAYGVPARAHRPA